MRHTIIYMLLASAIVCGCKRQPEAPAQKVEDRAAKQLLQGVWLGDGEDDVAFLAKGDSIFYPDTTSMAVSFRIEHDTLVMCGATEERYHILKQTAHLFVFENRQGDAVRLVKTDDPAYEALFRGRRAVVLNQRQVIRRDTVVMRGDERYHCYVQVSPTTYKVVKTTYNDDGVAVGNVYYDNIVHLGVYQGARCLYSSNFAKRDFAGLVPASFLSQSIFSDILYAGSDATGFSFTAELAIPDSYISYHINIHISSDGRKTMRVL